MIDFDALLYALAKFVQWNWPQSHGESQYVVMFGAFMQTEGPQTPSPAGTCGHWTKKPNHGVPCGQLSQ